MIIHHPPSISNPGTEDVEVCSETLQASACRIPRESLESPTCFESFDAA
jgi:hypothetical protein